MLTEESRGVCIFGIWFAVNQGWSSACAVVSLREGSTCIKERRKSIARTLAPDLLKRSSGKLIWYLWYCRRCSLSRNVPCPVRAHDMVSPKHHISALKGVAPVEGARKGFPIVSGAMKFGVPWMVVDPEEAPLRRLRPRSPSTTHHSISSGGLRCIRMF